MKDKQFKSSKSNKRECTNKSNNEYTNNTETKLKEYKK
jgi:hypothetical protein